MGRTYDTIDERWREWIAAQPMFFVGTAPLAGDGRVNVSPKGPGRTLQVLGPREVAYLDLVGSGAETVAHLRENGRIVVMLCAFTGPPRILRLHGHGEPLFPGDERFDELAAHFEPPDPPEQQRAIIRVEVERIADSCGYGVPVMRFEEEREHLAKSSAKRLRANGPHAMDDYVADKNAESIDGLPAVPAPRRSAAT